MHYTYILAKQSSIIVWALFARGQAQSVWPFRREPVFSGKLKRMNPYACLSALRGSFPKLLRRLVFSMALVVLLLEVLAVLLIDREPWVWQREASLQHYFAATRSILHNTARSPEQAKVRSVALSEEDLTAMANFALTRKNLKGFVQAKIDGSRLVILATVKLPLSFADYYLNLRLIADDAEPNAFVKQVKAGYIALPKPLVRGVGWWLAHTTHIGRYVQLTAPLFQSVRIGDGRLRIALNWDPEIMGQAQDLVTDLADKERLRVYHAKLAEVLGQSQTRRFIGLGLLVRPLFALAKERSDAEGGDAREENRAVILLLASYANGKNLGAAIFASEESRLLPRREVLLNRRVDAAQHFTASAVLAISGHRAFADVVGLAKEFGDTHGGSGFSFIDLAADRGGALFGKMAVGSDESARRLQQILSQTQEESAFMPATADLPENLKGDEFARQFGDINSPQFLALKQQIEERIAACRLYQ